MGNSRPTLADDGSCWWAILRGTPVIVPGTLSGGSVEDVNESASYTHQSLISSIWSYVQFCVFHRLSDSLAMLQESDGTQSLSYPCKTHSTEICKPPDLFLSLRRLEESKECYLRSSIWDMCSVFLLLRSWWFLWSTTYAALPSTCSYSFYLNFHASPLPKGGNWQIPSHLFDATMHCLIIPCMTFISWSSPWSKSPMIFNHHISLLDSGLRTIILNMHTFSQVYLRRTLYNSGLR